VEPVSHKRKEKSQIDKHVQLKADIVLAGLLATSRRKIRRLWPFDLSQSRTIPSSLRSGKTSAVHFRGEPYSSFRRRTASNWSVSWWAEHSRWKTLSISIEAFWANVNSGETEKWGNQHQGGLTEARFHKPHIGKRYRSMAAFGLGCAKTS